MNRISRYLDEVEDNAAGMSSAGRITYMYHMVTRIYLGAKKDGLTLDDKKIIGHFRDEIGKAIEPYETHLEPKDREKL